MDFTQYAKKNVFYTPTKSVLAPSKIHFFSLQVVDLFLLISLP